MLQSKVTLALTLALVVEGALFYTAYGLERIPQARPLELLPTEFHGWQMVKEGRIEKEVQDILRADDALDRVYSNGTAPLGASLFVAFFKTQRAGQAPHSPKNCLPGSGWEPLHEGTIDVPVESGGRSIRINRYIVTRGDAASVVLYWYQTRRRVIASEYEAKFWLVADSIRYHRSDTAMVRVVVPVVNGDEAGATRTAVDFVQAAFPVIEAYLPA
jgi:EpsI family protein